jgi:hypothetical protein
MNQTQSTGVGLVALVALLVYVAVIIGIAVLVIGGWWKVFSKAGKPGWAAIVPIYNIIIMLEIAGKPIWWILLCLIPVVNLIIIIIVMVEIAKAFGHGVGFAIGMILLGFIFVPILGFGSSQYIGARSA